ncbi:MAG: hypothetical protein R3A50_14625 [Saprospiraceae bacterium]
MKKLFVLLGLAFIMGSFTMKQVPPEIPADVNALLSKHGCIACHNMTQRLVGPSWQNIAGKKYSAKKISALVKKPEPGNWPGYVPMLAQPNVPKAELNKISEWLAGLK